MNPQPRKTYSWGRFDETPERLGYGYVDGNVMERPVAEVKRYPDGAWRWRIPDACLYGCEPSRTLAMEAVEDHLRLVGAPSDGETQINGG